MKLIQIKNIIKGEMCLVANCYRYGKYIGQLNDNLIEKYKNCNVCEIGQGFYRERGTEILIQVTPRLQKDLCKNCGWDNCWENPKHPFYNHNTQE